LYPILDLDRFQADFLGAVESADLPFDLRSILYFRETFRIAASNKRG